MVNSKKIVLLNGPVLSGKGFIANALIEELGGVEKEFKEELYRATAEVFDVDLRWLKGVAKGRKSKEQPFKCLCMGNGEAKSLYSYLGKDYTHKGAAYSASPREALIFTSEILYKPYYGDEYFGIKTSEKMEEGYNYVSDSGFKEEALVQVDKFGVDNVLLVRIHRDGCEFSSNDSRSYIDLSDVGVATLDLDNNRDIKEVVNDIKVFMEENFNSG